ncbi:MAG: LLM class flavin-dependent oxidoreductase [Ornithinibacter sp.]
MRFGAVIPRVAEREFADLAVVAEEAGWDMVFSWESVWGQDAWVTLGAASMQTERLRLGTLLTPASRYRLWDLATRVASVDRLSGGRVTLGVGLGALHGNWLAFEADEGRAVRARKLDEVLAIYAGLMGGQPFEFTGEHYSATAVSELVPPPPVQAPHPPVWCVGALVPGSPRQPSLERAARWQGVLPTVAGGASRRRDPTSPRSPSSTSWHGSAR